MEQLNKSYAAYELQIGQVLAVAAKALPAIPVAEALGSLNAFRTGRRFAQILVEQVWNGAERSELNGQSRPSEAHLHT